MKILDGLDIQKGIEYAVSKHPDNPEVARLVALNIFAEELLDIVYSGRADPVPTRQAIKDWLDVQRSEL